MDWTVWHICDMSIETSSVTRDIKFLNAFQLRFRIIPLNAFFPYPVSLPPPPLKWLLDRSNKVDKWLRPIQHEWHNIDGPWRLMTYFAFSGFDYKQIFYINWIYSLITLEIHRRTFKALFIKSSVVTATQKKLIFCHQLFPELRHMVYSYARMSTYFFVEFNNGLQNNCGENDWKSLGKFFGRR